MNQPTAQYQSTLWHELFCAAIGLALVQFDSRPIQYELNLSRFSSPRDPGMVAPVPEKLTDRRSVDPVTLRFAR